MAPFRVVYDTALRGVHHQVLLRDLGLIPVNKVTAARKGASRPRRSDGQREEKTVHVEDKQVSHPNGSFRTVRLYARGGTIGLGELTDTGDLVFVPLPRIRTHRTRDGNGLYRWYNDYALPPSYGAGQVTVRLHGTNEDTSRRLNRTENVRVIPPSDPDFTRLYRRRNDAESINRGVVDSLYIGRAHSLGHARQLVNLFGYALMVNFGPAPASGPRVAFTGGLIRLPSAASSPGSTPHAHSPSEGLGYLPGLTSTT